MLLRSAARHGLVDESLAVVDRALRTLFSTPVPGRPYPVARTPDGEPALTPDESDRSAALMRVNHVGEVCAQALYEAQALATQRADLKDAFRLAADEERDHLAWTARRIDELGGRPSLLNPVWYAGSFLIGLVAARAGDAVSLGFMAETERQVEQHLGGHLDRLPAHDRASRAVVAQMQADEASHRVSAQQMGAAELPAVAKAAMRLTAKLMTTVAHRL
jgi:ubiquinone biosynthesis monooxygenase Coq7